MTRPRLFAALALALMIAQTIASSFATLPTPPGAFDGIDKLMHASAWTLLGACLALAARRPSRRTAVIAVVIAVAFGISDEVHQSFVPGRDASLLDLVADGVGACVGAALATWYGRRRWRSGPSTV